jgi:hypothetical protein
MRYLLTVLSAIGLVSGSALAQSAGGVELAPVSNWTINYDSDSCALQRQFGAEGREVYLELRKFGPGDDLQIIVASKDFPELTGNFFVQMVPVDAAPRPIEGIFNLALPDDYKGRLFSYSLSDQDEEYAALYADFVSTTPVLLDDQRTQILEAVDLRRRALENPYRSRDLSWRRYERATRSDSYQAASRRAKRAFYQSDLYLDFVERRAASTQAVAFDGAFEERLFLRTGSLGPAFEAMDACLDELVAHWGVDVEAHRNLTRSVEPLDYNRLVREMVEDYPRDMARRRMPAYLQVRLDVSAEGAPTGCHLQSGISDPSFEEIACANMMRFAQFYPALDADGQAIPSYFQVAVIYRP